MDAPDPRNEIAELEVRIEELAATIESCRKVILMSRIAIAAGALLLAAMATGAVAFHPAAMLGAIAAVMGGIVLLGSNVSTSRQAIAALAAAETQRAELIGEIDLRTVGAAVPAPRELSGG